MARNFRSLLLAVALIALLTPPTGTAATNAAGPVEEFVVTTAGQQFAPAASGHLVVWSDQSATEAVIRGKNVLTGALFDVATGRVDARAEREQKLSPAIGGSIVVWRNRAQLPGGTTLDRVYGRDLSTPEQAPFPIATISGTQGEPAISGSTIVWADKRRGDWDIYGYDLTTRREFVVVGGTGDQLWPAVSGSIVVWADDQAGDWDLFGKDLATSQPFTITEAPGEQIAPAISGRVVVWQDTRAGRVRYDIHGYDLDRKQEFPITTAADYQLSPAIAGDLVVWEDFRQGQRSLYGYHLREKQEFRVTSAAGVQWQPALSGNLLVWSSVRGAGFAIAGARFDMPGVAPTFVPTFTPAGSDSSFAGVWNETDAPIVDGSAQRTWLWGPMPFRTGLEEYGEAPGGQRLVQYFDKSRMEISDPGGDRSDPWFVTNGLLARELITGRLQIGKETFVPLAPSTAPVAGDPDDPVAPSYASLASVLDRPSGAVGAPVMESIDREGTVREITPPGTVKLAYVTPETNHAVADVFWQFLNSEGPVLRGQAVTTGRLFEPTFYATGLPITEPYWTRARVGGVEKSVLLQCFERRCLTYTPENPPGWQVEMGNVGRHYYRWRYGQ